MLEDFDSISAFNDYTKNTLKTDKTICEYLKSQNNLKPSIVIKKKLNADILPIDK